MFDVTFTFENEHMNPVTVSCPPGANLLSVARLANVAIDAPCSGNGACGKCRVKLISGNLIVGLRVISLPRKPLRAGA